MGEIAKTIYYIKVAFITILMLFAGLFSFLIWFLLIGFHPEKTDCIILSVHEYPSRQQIRYILDTAGLTVKLTDHSVGFDSLLVKKTIQHGEFRPFANLPGKFSKDRYSSNCVEDGQIITLNFKIDGEYVKEVYFGNYYNRELANFINFINSQLAYRYLITYDQQKLEQSMQNCDSTN